MLPRLSATDKLRFEAEIIPHLDVLHRMARSVCCDPDLAADVMQEAFLKALRGFGGFRPGSNGRSWLARIVHNTCRDHWRARARQDEQPLDEMLADELETPGREPDWEPAIIRDSFDDRIEQALQELPPNWRAAILLVDVEGWSYEEASNSLGIPAGSLRSGLHRARKLLYRKLVCHDDADPPA